MFDVFLSHNSKDKPAVRRLAKILQKRRVTVWLDIEQLEPGGDWQKGLEEGIRASKTAAILVGKDGLGPWQVEEMKAILQLAARQKKKLIPILLPGAPKKPKLPVFVMNRTWLDLRQGLISQGVDKLIWGITGRKSDSNGQSDGTASGPVSQRRQSRRASEVIVAPTRLHHGADGLVGREKELAQLDAAWHDPKTHVVTIVAWGGVGKTALVVEWMARMARDGWPGAERVFDWSFYSQGTREQGAASADTFIAAALEFFGGEEGKELAASRTSPWDKGARLAQLVAQRRSLLVLDGLEPLQYPPGQMAGKLKDVAIEALLKGLAQYSAGLCLVTTRESVTDLASFRNTTSPEWPLEHLSIEAGADLLFQMGVLMAGNGRIKADDKELKDAAREVGGHALTLQLLGQYLAKVHNGDIRKRSLVAFQKADAKVQGGHAFKMMAAYEKWFADAGEEGKRQLAVLYLLGLFDRPADAACIGALRREPVIDGLTEPLVGLDGDDWKFTVSDIVERRLISCRENQSEVSDSQSTIDCHPLIREYFGKQLREKNPDAWRVAHRRLYEHLCATTPDKPQPTLEDLQPLYQAVVHACQAGRMQNAFHLYFARINQNSEENRQRYYSTDNLGAYASDLGAARCFFTEKWQEISPGLTQDSIAWLLNHAGYCLRALGHLSEAWRPVNLAYEILRQSPRGKGASGATSNLSGLELALGQIDKAVNHAFEAVRYADEEEDPYECLTRPSNLAEALLQRGRVDDALRHYKEPEPISEETPKSHHKFHYLRSFRFTEVFLSQVERQVWRCLLDLNVSDSALRDAVRLVNLERASVTFFLLRNAKWPCFPG